MAKKRVSLTLEESLVERLDVEADRRELNRSETVEDILKNFFETQGLDTAVILCGDPELRSLELYNGRSVLSHILEHLSDQGITRAILLTGENRERIEQEFGDSYEGVNLEYKEDDPSEKTAAALMKAEPELNSEFAIVNGHVIADVDLDEMHRFHASNDSMATMALTTVDEPSSYGVARLKGSQILGFEEKPEPGEEPSRLINAGTYVVSPDIFDSLGEESMEEVFEKLASRGELSGYIYGGEWKDVGE